MNEVMTDREIVNAILNVVQILGLALIAGWFQYKSKQWQDMTQRTEETTREAKELIQKNTEITEEIAKQTNGMTERLVNAVKKTSSLAGQAKGASNRHEEVRRDALEELEKEFMKDKKDDG